MLQLPRLTADHLARLELDTEPDSGKSRALSLAARQEFAERIERGGVGFALVAEDGAVLGALMMFSATGASAEVFALIGWRARPRMVAITRQVRRMLDGVQSLELPSIQTRLTPGMAAGSERWLRLLGFSQSDKPVSFVEYPDVGLQVFLRFTRRYTGPMEPAHQPAKETIT